MTFYNDTITLYKVLPTQTQLVMNTSDWVHHIRREKAEDHYFIHYKDITCRFFPDRYGTAQFWITFSIPKLMNGNNLLPVDLPNPSEIYTKTSDILDEIVTFPTHEDVSTWEVSRTDLFLLHAIPPEQRVWYLSAYSRLSLGSYVPYNHENTFYLNSTLKKHKAAGTVVRIYPKLQEIQDKQPVPKDIEDDFERCMVLDDELVDIIRIEFQFRRRVLRYFFKGVKSVTFADVMNPDFQKKSINRMIQRLGLNLRIVSRKMMLQILPSIFKRKATLQRAEDYITLINKDRNVYPKTVKAHFTANHVSYIRRRLKEYGLHSIVSEFMELKPISPK